MTWLVDALLLPVRAVVAHFRAANDVVKNAPYDPPSDVFAEGLVAAAVLAPDDPSLPADLTSDYWRAYPTEPLSPSELVRWKNITDRYEWVAAPYVKGDEK